MRTHLLYGEFLRRSRRSDARVHLRSAIEASQQLSAAPWQERAAGELRATGETAQKREPTMLAGLTALQPQIALLAR
jgi:hypothetical protein